MKRILTVNPGSTSTKIAYFHDDEKIVEKNIEFPKPEPAERVHVMDEFEARMESIRAFLKEEGIGLSDIDIFVSRGGAPGKVEYGAYEIDKTVVRLLCFSNAPTYHASNLAPILAFSLAREAGGKPAIFYDAVAADQAPDIAHVSGVPGIGRHVGCHNLNARMVAREAAEQLGKKYEGSKFVVAHLGGGISVSAHENGIIVDSVMCDEGPMAPQRGGRLSFIEMLNLCYREGKSLREMQMITDQGGLLSYFKVNNMIELEEKISAGDKEAAFMYEVMAYQVCKAIGEMFTVLRSEADAIVLTGGVANSSMFTSWIEERVGRLAPILVIPGEREMLAMARGGLRVLNGEEEMKHYTELPKGFGSMQDYIEAFRENRPDLLDRPAIKELMEL